MESDAALTDEEKDRARRLIQFAKDNPLPLTDEELAEMGQGHEEWRNLAGHAFCKFCWPASWPCRTSRLIAALRAGREEVERLLTNQITHEYDEETGYCLCRCCDHGL